MISQTLQRLFMGALFMMTVLVRCDMSEVRDLKPDYEVPDIEMFFGKPYKAFCGRCGRIIATGGIYEETKKRIEKCPHCGCSVNWQ